jgi:hypothetical protein
VVSGRAEYGSRREAGNQPKRFTRASSEEYERGLISRRAESAAYHSDQAWPTTALVDKIPYCFSIPLALSVATTFGAERHEMSAFPASRLAAFAPVAPANAT